MTAENRVLALEWARADVTPQGGLPAAQVAGVTTVAGVYYRWLEGPVILTVVHDSITYEQAAPDGPGTPTRMEGNAVQLTDLQQVTLTVAEADSKGQPVSDTLAWSVDQPAVIGLVPSADTQSCLCVAGTDGTAVVTVTDSSVTPPLTASDTLTVVSSAATSLLIAEGTPEDQPPAAPPA